MMQPAHSMLRSVRWLPLCAALLLSACATLPPARFTTPTTRAQAEAAAAQGRYAEAAAAFEALAANAGAPERNDLLLAGARNWLDAQRFPEANRVVAAIVEPLTSVQRLTRQLLGAETDLGLGQGTQAWAQLNALQMPADASTARQWQSLRVRAALAVNRPVDAVRAEMTAEGYAGATPESTRQLRMQLLNALRDARDRGVKLEPQSTQDQTIRGWLELGALATRGNGVSLSAANLAASWRSRYPNHPALSLLNDALPALTTPQSVSGGIALLLPLTGSAASLGSTVRDGFTAAYNSLGIGMGQLHVYDTAALGVDGALQSARADGAGLIVGPLTRQDVAAAADRGSSGVPVLALNSLPTGRDAPSGFYQFALSPEEEAREVADRLLAQGQKRGVALVPSGEWGQRVYAAFLQELQAGGGTVLAQYTVDASGHDFSNEIKAALGTSESEVRRKRIESITGASLNFEPRRRADLQFVFAPGSSQLLRLLRQQLLFYYAGDLATYSTSDAYDADAGASNQDLEGLYFPDMPWMLDTTGTVDSLRAQIGQTWAGRSAWRSRLFAFGFDACQLALSLPAARRNPAELRIAGLSGELSLEQDGRIHRVTEWAQMRNGTPQPVSTESAN
ncbi:MAG: penicillin-binding protein activator [Steroidobacteraceae bacterium]